mmetsp:Transcript_33326/g.99235  ORF Transcript_33326/g.99235 Transcript_33326/m.99235 type:complete len:122 (-) Transcript_33326:337-702(-)
MGTVWERLTTQKSRSGEPGAQPQLLPAPGDREGVHLYADFTDCLDSHKGHAFVGIAGLTIPLAWYKKSITPLMVGFIIGFVPDLLYANWRCDEKYKAFRKHADAFMKQQQQQRQFQPPGQQ